MAGRYLRFLALVVCLLAFTGTVRAEDPKDLRIIRITPEGEDVGTERQIVIEFNRPVVPIGRMDRTAEEVGVKISPAVKCQWRWLNTSTLACNLDEQEKLPPATSYTLSVEPVIAAEDGAHIEESYQHSFVTQRPSVSYNSFRDWKSPVHPVIRLAFNQPVAKNSVAAHIYLETGADKDIKRYALNVFPDKEDEDMPIILPVPGEKAVAVTAGGKRKSDDKLIRTAKGEEARRIWMVEPVKELPAASSFRLMQEAGLVSASGPEKGIAGTGPVVTFSTFPAFEFKGIRCFDKNDNELLLEPGQPQTPERLCNPMRYVALAFSTPVMRSQVKAHAIFTPDLAGGRKDYNPWGDEDRDMSMLDQPYEDGRLYYIALPVGLKAAQTYKLHIDGRENMSLLRKLMARKLRPKVMEDQFSRTLVHSVTMSFATGHRNPNYVLPSNEAVLEKGVDSEVPIYVNNLKSVTTDYRKVTPSGDAQDQSVTQSIPGVEDVQFAVPMGIRDMLDGGTGAVYGLLKMDPPVIEYRQPYIFAQVTPYQVHLKMGHFQSIAWVTDMASGQTVADAKVSVYVDSFDAMSSPASTLAEAATDQNGVAILPGVNTLDPQRKYLSAWRQEDPRLFLRVDKGQDMALLPLSSDFSVSTWDAAEEYISENGERVHGHMLAWGMTAQGIYRAGDKIQYKIFVRDQDNRTLIPPSAGAVYSLKITDPLGKTVETVKDVKMSAFGSYAGEFTVPKAAAVGWYGFSLIADFPAEKTAEAAQSADETDGDEESGDEVDEEDGKPGHVKLYPLRVLVSDFTPSPFNVTADISGDHFRAGDRMDIASAAHLHSGGAYTDASVRATVTLSSAPFASSDPVAKNFSFDSITGETDSIQLYQKQAPLDDKGEWKDTLVLLDQNIVYGKLSLETAVGDDRGKSVAAQAQADYAGVDRLVGLKSPQWIYNSGKPVSISGIVVDDHGVPVAGVPISMIVERQEISTVKVKGSGNAYLSDTTIDWKQTSSCDLVSAKDGVPCGFTPAAPGLYRITASIKDTKGKPHSTKIEIWVSGSDYVQWDDHSEKMLPIVPEKAEYHVGDTARYLIKNPYPGAKALVTIERYGVIETFVKTLEGSTPVIEFPVKPDYMPGFYLSVVVVSPRAEKPLGEGRIDLGKPAFRIGYVAVPVRDPYKEMDVTVKVAGDVFRPRDTIEADLTAKPRFAPDTPQPVELAVAVLDESVFDLIWDGKDAFDPYKGFYSLDPLDVANYSLMTQLVGRQKFEKKGANPGGDGGSDLSIRNIFKYVSYWNPSVPVDAEGHAHISFQAPDNLTGWRVLALAVTPGDRMGLGQGNFKVNRPTELRPVMPNQVREGDKFSAGFSIMNRTDHDRTMDVTIEAAGDLKDGKPQTKTDSVTLAPYKRTTVFIPLEAGTLPVEREIQEGKVTFKATAGDESDADGVEFTLPVGKSRTYDVAAQYATTTEEHAQEHIAFPADIYTDTGDVSVVLSPSVIGNVAGAFRYMRDYPYTCWEQRLTRGVMAAHYKSLRAYLPASLEWPGSDTLPQEMLDEAAGYQAPNGGMSYFVGQDEYADPYLSAYTALAFGWLRKDGYKVPEEVEKKLHDYLLAFLRQDTAPDFYQPGMKSTVRAVALAALAESGKVTKDDLLRYEPYLKEMSLFGKAHFLAAASTLGQVPEAKKAADMILSTGVESGGKFMFNEIYDDGYARILATPVRDNCAILDAFMLYGKTDKAGKELIGDKPFRLVRSITQSRGSRDYWENTQENMFCMNALTDYARTYEAETPAMSVDVALDQKSFGKASFKDVKDTALTLSRPIEKADPGRNAVLDINRTGKGRLYYAARLRYALQAGKIEAANAGMDIHREYSIKKDGKWTLLPADAKIARGDLVRADLFLSLPTARNFVVVDDPVPGGLEPVNRDLATASGIDAAEGDYDSAGGSIWFRYNDWHEYNYSRWSFYHEELRHDSARFYADWLPPGNYHLSYTAQAVAEGAFAVPPVNAGEMYDPDIYGRGADSTLTVGSGM